MIEKIGDFIINCSILSLNMNEPRIWRYILKNFLGFETLRYTVYFDQGKFNFPVPYSHEYWLVPYCYKGCPSFCSRVDDIKNHCINQVVLICLKFHRFWFATSSFRGNIYFVSLSVSIAKTKRKINLNKLLKISRTNLSHVILRCDL